MIIFREKLYSKPLELTLYKFYKLTGKSVPGSNFAAGRKAILTGANLRVNANTVALNPGRAVSSMVGEMVESPVNGAITAAVPGGVAIGKVVKPVTEYVDKPIRKFGPSWLKLNVYDKGINTAVEAGTNWLTQISH